MKPHVFYNHMTIYTWKWGKWIRYQFNSYVYINERTHAHVLGIFNTI